jgi:hypothetical protein
MLRRPAEGVPQVRGFAEGRVVHDGPLESLASISAEGGSSFSRLRSSLSHLEVGLDLPLLERFTLIDTPGLNSPIQAHTRATEAFTARAKVVIWVTSCLQPLSKFERAQIESLPPDIRLLVVVNHIDQLDPAEDSVEQVCKRIDRNLHRSDMKVIGLSAKLALEGILRDENRDFAGDSWATFNRLLDECVKGEAQSQLSEARFEKPLDALAQTLLQGAVVRSTRLHSMEKTSLLDSALCARLDQLVCEEGKLAEASDPMEAILEMKFPDDFEVSDDLSAKFDDLAHATQLIGLAVTEFSSQGEMFDTDSLTLKTHFDSWEVEWNECQKSGLFGQGPVFFKGKQNKLIARRENLETRYDGLNNRERVLQSTQQKIKVDMQRASKDAGVLVGRLLPEVRGAIRALVATINEGRSEFNADLSTVNNFAWVDTLSREIQASGVWGLQDLLQGTHPTNTEDSVSASPVHDVFHAVRKTISNPHSYAPLLPLKTPPLPRLYVENPQLEFKVKKVGRGKSALATLCIFALMVLLFGAARWLHTNYFSTPPVTPPSQVPTQPLQQTVPVVEPIDDVSAIKLDILGAGEALSSPISMVLAARGASADS